MAAKLKELWKSFNDSLPGAVVTAAIYAAMLLLVLLFFTGNGQFLYEM